MTSPKRGNIFALFLILFSTIASLVISIVLANTGADIEKAQLVLIIIQDLIILLIPVLLYCLISHTSLLSIIPHERLSGKNILYIILLTILVSPLIVVVSAVTTMFYPADINTVILNYINKLPMPLCILALAVMPAVFEELAFRGVILSNYKSVGLLKAALVSGLFFGLFHMDFYQMGYAVIAGIFFSSIVRYTNSIYASMLSHFLINGVQVVYTKLVLIIINKFHIFGENSLNEIITQSSQASNSYAPIITGIFFTVVATPLLIMTFKKFMQHNKTHKLDYELSITQKKSEEFEINIDNINNDQIKFVDIYFIAYFLIAIVLTILTK